MKVDIKIAGAQYKDVPALIAYSPTGTVHRFYDVSDTTAEAADVARGKVFYDSSGTLQTGTNDYTDYDNEEF